MCRETNMDCEKKARGQTSCDFCVANNQQCEFALAFINGVPFPAGRNLALQDYQMQMMLLEQQNRRRLLLARQLQNPDYSGPSSSFAVPGPSSSFAVPSSQNPVVQYRSIQVYAQQLAKTQHESMQNARSILDRQSTAEHRYGSRSNDTNVYVRNDSAALQTRVNDVPSDSDANASEGVFTTPVMQAHGMPPERSNGP